MTEMILASCQWFDRLIDKEPKAYSHLQKVLFVDRKACRFVKSELERRKLLGELESFLVQDALKFLHLMEIIFCIYLAHDGDKKQLALALEETQTKYEGKNLRHALSCLHLKLGMLNFRYPPTEIETDLLLYLEKVRPLLWQKAAERFNLTCEDGAVDKDRSPF